MSLDEAEGCFSVIPAKAGILCRVSVMTEILQFKARSEWHTTMSPSVISSFCLQATPAFRKIDSLTVHSGNHPGMKPAGLFNKRLQ